MTTTPISGCFGIACRLHPTCQRYANVVGPAPTSRATCETQGKRPLFVPIVAAQGVAA